MYKVKNIIHGKVLLADLDNLIIAHNSAVDLDSRFSRERIKNSANLKKALSEECKYLVLLEDSEKDLQESLKSIGVSLEQIYSGKDSNVYRLDLSTINKF